MSTYAEVRKKKLKTVAKSQDIFPYPIKLALKVNKNVIKEEKKKDELVCI